MPALLHFSTDYPFSNRAAVYGDGCFTTMAVANGKTELLTRHISRLQQGCFNLQISIADTDWQALKTEISNSAIALDNGIVKVLISSGYGGRGYLRDANSEAICYLQTLPPVSHYESWRRRGISLGVSPFALSFQPAMGGTKHLNRIEQVLIKEQRTSCEDDIVLDPQEILVEATAGNIFWRNHGRWFTPDLSLCGVDGVMRNLVIPCIERRSNQVNTIRTKIDALQGASDVFICNSLMKVVPVNKIVVGENQILTFNNDSVANVAQLVNKAIEMESE